MADFTPETGLMVAKERIAEDGAYNLSGERYREGLSRTYRFPMVELGNAELFRIESGGTPKSEVKEYWDGGAPWITLVDLPPDDGITEIVSTQRTISEDGLKSSSARLLPANSIVVSSRATIGRIGINRIPLATNQGFKNIVIEDKTRAIPEYVALALTKLVPVMQANASGATCKEITKTKFSQLTIPLPPADVPHHERGRWRQSCESLHPGNPDSDEHRCGGGVLYWDFIEKAKANGGGATIAGREVPTHVSVSYHSYYHRHSHVRRRLRDRRLHTLRHDSPASPEHLRKPALRKLGRGKFDLALSMRWFVLGLGLLLLGGLTAVGYGTMIWLAYFAGAEPTAAQVELLNTAREPVQNGAIMLGAFIFGWLAGQVR